MRKLKLQTQVSIDGYMAGPNGEMDWMEWNWDDDLKQYVTELTESIDSILLGRKLAEGFIPHWKNALDNPEMADESARIFVETPKVVFTKTLEKSEWDHTVLAKGDLSQEINTLKQKEGKDMIAYGGSDFVSNLIKVDLIDEYHLFVNPTAIGQGLPIFKERKSLKLIQTHPFKCGIVVLVYSNI